MMHLYFLLLGDDGTSVGSALYLLSQDKKINFNNKKIKICFYGKKIIWIIF